MNNEIKKLTSTIETLLKEVASLDARLAMVEDLQWQDTQRMLEEQGMAPGEELSADIDWADVSPAAIDALMTDILGEVEPTKAPVEYTKLNDTVIEFPTQFTRQPQT